MRGWESDAVYFMRRAREEAHIALQLDSDEAAAAHYGLSVELARRARQAIQIEALAPPRSAFPQLGGAPGAGPLVA
jgi:hypothetical protein